MAQTDTRPGFRLPWSSDRADASNPTDVAPDASADPGDAPATEESDNPAMIDVSPAVHESETTEAVAEPIAYVDAEPEAAAPPPAPKQFDIFD